MESRIELEDYQLIQKLIQKLPKTSLIHLRIALHEFLRDGKQAVVDVLIKMKKEFPGSYFILGEFNKCTDSEFQNIPIYERMHMLFYQEIIHGCQKNKQQLT